MKWYQKPVWIAVLLIVFFPVGLYLMWRYTKWYKTVKAIAAGLVILVAIPICVSACSSNASIGKTQQITTLGSVSVVTTSVAETTLQTTTHKETPTPAETKPSTTETAASTEITIETVMQTSGGGVLRVHYLDVGQADSAFIELPDGKSMLIDAGNKGDGSSVVSYIKNLGYSTIDYLVATHPHEDHIGGMATVINSFNIGQIYMPKVASTTQAFEGLLTTIQDKGYSINTAQAGVQIAPGINILSPGVGSDYGDELNNWSAVISIVYGSNTFLFMGDAGTDPESSFTIDADVVKISHHGSRTAYSSSLYSKLSPTIAIIDVGADNSYGLPDEEVIQGLTDVGAIIYRTDTNGTIVVESDGSTVTTKSIEKTTPIVPVSTAATTPKETTVATTVVVTEPATTAAPVLDTGTGEVYKTETGSKYHSDGCSYLSKSRIPISLADAKAEGLTPCSRCNPPQ